MLAFPNQIHRYYPGTENKGFILLFNQSFSGDFLQTFQKFHPESPFLNAEQIPTDIELAVQRLLSPSVRANTQLSFAWIQVILANLLPQYTLLENNATDETDTLCRIMHYIMENFREPLTLKYLAKELHLNEYYLSHTISEHLQMNFREYLNKIRLDYATRMLQSTNIPLTNIWADAGFESQTTFNRVFKSHMNMTPSQYRQNGIKLYSHELDF